jgi:hypothetical protein
MGPRDGGRTASIQVKTERDFVMLTCRSRSYGEDWSDVEQHIGVEWTPCRFGGGQPWFVCSVRSNGVFCGRQVTKLYNGGRLFACRHCYELAYESKQESAHHRGLLKASKSNLMSWSRVDQIAVDKSDGRIGLTVPPSVLNIADQVIVAAPHMSAFGRCC